MRRKIKGLILDFGGVISQPQAPDRVATMSRLLNLPVDTFKDTYFSLRGRLDLGRITSYEYWREIMAVHSITPKVEIIDKLIREDVLSWTRINDEMISFIRDKRAGTEKISIISNMTLDCLDYIEKNFRWLNIFDSPVFSCNLGLIKPDKPIYEYCLRNLNLQPDECLFTDDSGSNVLGAKNVGMHAIHFSSFLEFLDQVNEHYT
ncbi:MAG: HAD family phosphatase, partial [Spirochaetota bacterium]